MKSIFVFLTKDIWMSFAILFLILLSVSILISIDPNLFPLYTISIILSILCFWFFSQVGFEIVSLFSKQTYVLSIFLLILTLVIGRVTRGTVRWIPLGPLNLQAGEFVRPFLLVFFSWYLTKGRLNLKRFINSLFLLGLPVVLIFIQPSLGVSVITVVGFLGVLISSSFNKKYILFGLAVLALVVPIFWNVMAPYQKQRILTFLEPGNDPLGAGYNSLQSVIAVGDGQIFGRGLGEGSQTQLSFLPAKQTDFIFSATAEELGFFGAVLMLLATFVILWRLSMYMGIAVNPTARAYLSGFFATYLAQVFVHVGMNLGFLPVTGLPFPLVSAGGSSLLATMIGLGIATGSYKT